MKDWVDRFKVFRRLSIVWVGWLITHATLAVYSDITSITPAVGVVYASTVGLLGLLWGKYFYDRAEEDKHGKK